MDDLCPRHGKPRRKRSRLPLPPPPTIPGDDALLTIREVAAWRRTGVSTAWRDVRSGLLPPPVYVGPKSPRWRFRAIRAAEGAE
jgi:predicted DNA-binding transcriptional regulator AlpA